MGWLLMSEDNQGGAARLSVSTWIPEELRMVFWLYRNNGWPSVIVDFGLGWI
jgi:hypothetical protein